MEFENITYCNSYENIVNLSDTCVNSFNVTLSECIQNNDDIKFIIRMLMGIWSSLIAVCGTAGNLLTLLAIPHAAKHNRWVSFHGKLKENTPVLLYYDIMY